MKPFRSAAAVCALLLTISANAGATILTFDLFGPGGSPPADNGSLIPNEYGDRVAAVSDAVGLYGVGNGFTPNVTAEYRTRSINGLPPIVDGTSNTILFGDGSVRFADGSVRFGDGSVRVGDGTTEILADGSVRFVSTGDPANLGDGTVPFGDGSMRGIPGQSMFDYMRFWQAGFGGLSNIAYPSDFLGVGEVILIADPGFEIVLNGFDLAGTEGARGLGLLQVRNRAGDLIWDNIPLADGSVRSIADGTSNTLLFAETPPPLTTRSITDGTSNTIIFGETPASFTSFPVSLRGRELHIVFGAAGTAGIDNINFDQVAAPVPEPCTLLLAGFGGLAALFARGAARRPRREG